MADVDIENALDRVSVWALWALLLLGATVWIVEAPLLTSVYDGLVDFLLFCVAYALGVRVVVSRSTTTRPLEGPP